MIEESKGRGEAHNDKTKLKDLLGKSGIELPATKGYSNIADLELGDLWRANGWCIDDEGLNDEQKRQLKEEADASLARIQNLTVEDIRNINKKVEAHVMKKTGRHWHHCNPNEATLCGCATCAAAVDPRHD